MSFLEPYNFENMEGNVTGWHNLYNYTLGQIRTAIPACIAITAGQTLGKGDPFIVGDDNIARKAVADGSTLCPADGLTESTTIGSGGSGYGRIYGKMTLTTTLSTTGYYYLHPTTPGALTTTEPDLYSQPMAKALDLITLLVNPFVWKKSGVDPTSTNTIKDKVISDKMVNVRDKAMFGDMELSVIPNSWSSYADTLNATSATSYIQTLTISLKTAGGETHDWFVNTLGLGSTEDVLDADVAAPTLSNTGPVLIAGETIVTVEYDTDAGSTKTYTIGDFVTVTVNTITLMGYVIPAVTYVDSIQ